MTTDETRETGEGRQGERVVWVVEPALGDGLGHVIGRVVAPDGGEATTTLTYDGRGEEQDADPDDDRYPYDAAGWPSPPARLVREAVALARGSAAMAREVA